MRPFQLFVLFMSLSYCKPAFSTELLQSGGFGKAPVDSSSTCRLTASNKFVRFDKQKNLDVEVPLDEARKSSDCPKLINYTEVEKAYSVSINKPAIGLYGTTVRNGLADDKQNADIMNMSLRDLEHKKFCRVISETENHCIKFEKGIMTDDGNLLFGNAPENHVYSLNYSSGRKIVYIGKGPIWKETEFKLDGKRLIGPDGLVFTEKLPQ